jgi:hypothetical protein
VLFIPDPEPDFLLVPDPKIPDPGVKKAPDPGSATLLVYSFFVCCMYVCSAVWSFSHFLVILFLSSIFSHFLKNGKLKMLKILEAVHFVHYGI